MKTLPLSGVLSRIPRSEARWFLRSCIGSIVLLLALDMIGATAALDRAWCAHLDSWIRTTTKPHDAPVFVVLDRIAYQQRILSDKDTVDLHNDLLTRSPLRVIASQNAAQQLNRARAQWPAMLERAINDRRLILCEDGIKDEDHANMRRRCVADAIGQLPSAELPALWTEREAPALSAAHISESANDQTWFEGRTIFVGDDSNLDQETANWLAAISRVPGIHPLDRGFAWLIALLLSIATLLLTRTSSTLRAVTSFAGLTVLTASIAIASFNLFALIIPIGLLGTALLTSATVGGLLERYRIEQRLDILARPAASQAESSADTEPPIEDLSEFLTGMLSQLGVPVSSTILLARHTDGELRHIVTTGERLLPHEPLISAIASAELTAPKWWNGLAPEALFRCYVIPLNSAFHRLGYWILCVSPEQMIEANQKLFIALGRIVCARVRTHNARARETAVVSPCTRNGPIAATMRVRASLRAARMNADAMRRAYEQQPFSLIQADAAGSVVHTNIAGRRLLHTAGLDTHTAPTLAGILSSVAGMEPREVQTVLTKLILGAEARRFHACLDLSNPAQTTFNFVLAWRARHNEYAQSGEIAGGSFTLSAIRRAPSNAVASSTAARGVDLRPLITSSIAWARERAPDGFERNFEISYEDPLPRVVGHYNSLTQALEILFLDVFLNGGAEAVCRVSVTRRENGVYLRIEDSESAIPEAALPALFVAPADRVDNSEVDIHLGGAQQLIAECDGILSVDAFPGSGVVYSAEFKSTVGSRPYRGPAPR